MGYFARNVIRNATLKKVYEKLSPEQDIFRPSHEPARIIYDALLREAKKRSGRTVEEWQKAEQLAVWQAARDYAQQYDMRIPTMADVLTADEQGSGHVDYAAKIAYTLTEIMRKKPR